MKRFGVQPYHHVGVVGIGGLGHLALQFAHALGCEVTAFSTNPDKREDAFAFGADHFAISSDVSHMQRATGTFDFVLSAANAPLPWVAYIKALRPNGQLIVVSRLHSNKQEAINTPSWLLVAGQKSISGSVTGGRAVTEKMFTFAARHNVEAKTESSPLRRWMPPCNAFVTTPHVIELCWKLNGSYHRAL